MLLFGSLALEGLELSCWFGFPVLECLANTYWGVFMDLWIGLAYGRLYVWFILGSAEWPQACLAPVSRAWPAYLGKIGCCLRPSLGSGGCFLEVGGGKTLEKLAKYWTVLCVGGT